MLPSTAQQCPHQLSRINVRREFAHRAAASRAVPPQSVPGHLVEGEAATANLTEALDALDERCKLVIGVPVPPSLFPPSDGFTMAKDAMARGKTSERHDLAADLADDPTTEPIAILRIPLRPVRDEITDLSPSELRPARRFAARDHYRRLHRPALHRAVRSVAAASSGWVPRPLGRSGWTTRRSVAIVLRAVEGNASARVASRAQRVGGLIRVHPYSCARRMRPTTRSRPSAACGTGDPGGDGQPPRQRKPPGRTADELEIRVAAFHESNRSASDSASVNGGDDPRACSTRNTATRYVRSRGSCAR